MSRRDYVSAALSFVVPMRIEMSAWGLFIGRYNMAKNENSYKSKHHLDGAKKPISKSAKEQAKKKAAFFSTDSEQLSFG